VTISTLQRYHKKKGLLLLVKYTWFLIRNWLRVVRIMVNFQVHKEQWFKNKLQSYNISYKNIVATFSIYQNILSPLASNTGLGKIVRLTQ
jgi:hypothetical protein